MTKEEILQELEINIDAICFNYQNAFKKSEENLQTFFNSNGEKIRKEIANASTNALHNGIMNNLAQDQDFTQKVLEQNFLGAQKLHNSLLDLG